MAQIIKHRRGSITQLKDVTARIGELVVATGSISDLNGPMVFVGETEGVAGAYRPLSKIYQGTAAPTITVGSHGSVIDGTPFYATGNKTLYILSKDGNTDIDLTGNIEGNLISGVTINNLTGTTIDISSDLSVGGDISLSGDLFITGNTYQTGNIDLTGDIVLGGSITIGDQTTDVINFGGEVSSSIVPDVHNAFDLGSPTQNWRNLHVSGTAYVNILEAQSISLDGITVFDDLAVSGSTYLGNGGGDIVVVSGSIYNDALTQNRIVVVGANGEITDNGDLVFDTTKVQVGLGNFEVDVLDGDIRTSGSLVVSSTSELKGAVGINSTLDVTGSAQFKSTIDVDGEATLSSAIVEDLTQNRVVAVGTGGALVDYSGFTFDGGKLVIGGGLFEVDVLDGDVRTSGSLTIDGGQTINGDVTVNGVLTVTGNTQLQANLYVSGNLEVLGSATNVTIQSTTVEIDDNIIRLNAYSPFERYAGFEVIDSGSSGVSASMVWDSLNDYWMFVSSSGQASKMIGTTAATYGSEISLTDTYFPIATGPNTIGDSLLRYSGTTLSFNTNKFTVDSGTGDTLVSGNFTLSYSGGTDNGNNTSAIMFRNSNNVVGFISTTETTDVLDGILGYKNSDGALVFSTVIDGGGY
jgi:cytoskeletal protein CcmA (bactofilin family)